MVTQLVAQFVSDLRLPLSQIRLETYRPRNGSDLDMLTSYFWNIDLAEALVPCLHAVELALRNSIHTACSAHYGTDLWFYTPQLLESGQLSEFSRAFQKVAKKSAPIAPYLVAELPFGFWVTLLSGPYDQPIWAPNHFALLRAVFPHTTNSRDQIHTRFNHIRMLRNRVMHHEAIWDQTKINLPQKHTEIHEAIQWISPTLGRAIQAVDSFQTNFNGRAQVEAGLKQRLGIPWQPG
jgi:hypothetical protein